MILIVDDKPENIFSLKSILELNNFEVDTALSGEEALKKVLKQTYALFILDVQMPGMDGFEVAEAISGYNKTKDTPIIFLSAVNTDKKFITKGFESGGIDYITKPVDPDILILKVRTFYRLYLQNHALNEAHQSLQQEVEVRKEAEKALSATIEEMHSTLESLPQVAFTAKPDGSIDFVNTSWFRFSPNRNTFPQTPPDDVQLEQEWKRSVETGKSMELEVRIKELATGDYCFHLLRTTPVMTNGQIVKWVGTLTDIHEQKQIHEVLEQRVEERTRELLDMNKALESSNDDLQQFASVASHDLREPLRKIQFFTSIIQEKFTLDKEVLHYFHKIAHSSERMDKLIQDLLRFSRLSEAGFFQTVDINSIINDILVDLELSITEKGATVHVGPMPQLEVIPGLIRQLFQNIISNAIKFSKADIAPVILISAVQVEHPEAEGLPPAEEGYYRICIRDNGIGFDERYAHKIFTLFQRLNAREVYEGTGIGLAIAKKIVEKHKGDITARSTPGEGSTFIITLPVKQKTSNKELQVKTTTNQ